MDEVACRVDDLSGQAKQPGLGLRVGPLLSRILRRGRFIWVSAGIERHGD
jgi:hypothetical protein